MNKIFQIIKREYITRIRKKTFWILTLLGPVLYTGIFALPFILMNSNGQEKHIFYVNDESGYFREALKSDQVLSFIFIDSNKLKQTAKMIMDNKYYHILLIHKFNINNPEGFELISNKNAGLRINMLLTDMINKTIKDIRIKNLGLDKKVIENLEPHVSVSIKTLSESGLKKEDTKAASLIAGLTAFLNYMLIFLYGSLILRGVQEEKSNRIVEVIISAVKPFELMFGKILGVALVGLTQFILWIILTLIFISTFLSAGSSFLMQAAGDHNIGTTINMFSNVNMVLILSTFLFYFITGYLLYSAMFAAVASAVDNQSDIQQFMLPITVPLILGIIMIPGIIDNPNSTLAFWMSMIPLTSPIVMMVRVAFGVPAMQLVASMILMVAGFLIVTWLAAKIYRIGILSYGTKVGYKDLWKWLFYK